QHEPNVKRIANLHYLFIASRPMPAVVDECGQGGRCSLHSRIRRNRWNILGAARIIALGANLIEWQYACHQDKAKNAFQANLSGTQGSHSKPLAKTKWAGNTQDVVRLLEQG